MNAENEPEEVTMFCVRCQKKNLTTVREQHVTKNNRLIVKGFCSECGGKVTTILGVP